MRGWSVRALALGAMATGCLDPTQATFEITTDVTCGPEERADGALLEVGLVAGGAEALREGDLQGTTRACTPGDGTHRVGDVVVYPADGASEARLMVVAGLGDARAEDCMAFARGDEASAFAPSCIVARRRVAFVDQTDLQVPVFLDATCAGVACDEDSTCARRGGAVTCVDASVACRGDACSIEGEGGADATSSQSSGSASSGGGQGAGEQGGGGGASTGGGVGGAGGDGGAGGSGGGGALIEPVAVDGFIEGLTAITGAAGEPGPLVVIRNDPAGDTILRVDDGLLVPVLTQGTQALSVVVREYPSEQQRIVARAPDAVHRSYGAPYDLVATDVALLRGGLVIAAGGTDALLSYDPVANDPATITLSGTASVLDTYDGIAVAAAGDSLCRVDEAQVTCFGLVAPLGDVAVDVAVGPVPGGGGMEAMAVVPDGGLALVRFETVDGVPTLNAAPHTPPTTDLAIVRGRVTVTGSSVDGVWLAGARAGGAFLARGVRVDEGISWRIVDELSEEVPLVDLWVAPTDGSRAWVVTDDGRVLAVTLP